MGKSWRYAMRRSLAILLVIGAAIVAAPQLAASGSAPPGATARCKDGTYSYSQHRQGTCSHHGGVAVWLSGSSTTTTKSSSTTGGKINVGSTVLLRSRTKTSGCTRGANPDRRCSPGAYYSKLTKAVICSASFRTSSIRNVPQSEKYAVEAEYGMAQKLYGRTLEIDHIVSLELGGSNDIANLFPEKASPAPGYKVKDKLENKLHSLVCSGSMSLRSVRIGIAANWQTLYRKVYGTAPVG